MLFLENRLTVFHFSTAELSGGFLSRFVWARQGKGKSVGKVKDLVKFSSFEDRRWVQDPLGTFGP